MRAQDDRSARVESVHPSPLMRTSKASKSANDSIEQQSSVRGGNPAKREYVTRSRVAVLGRQLNRRQWAILGDSARLGVLSGRQIRRLHYGPSTAGARLARKHLGQLTAWRVLTRLDRSVGGRRAGSAGYIYALGPAGQRLIDPDRKRFRPPWTPRPSYLRHALAVSQLYTELREQERSSAMELVAFESEPNCWRRYFGPGGARSILKPDALVVVGLDDIEDRYFIEADCSTEPGPRIRAKAKTYVRYWQSGREQAAFGIFPYVLWIAPTAKRANLLVDVLAKLDPDQWQLFLVMTAEEAPDRIADGTAATNNNREEVT